MTVQQRIIDELRASNTALGLTTITMRLQSREPAVVSALDKLKTDGLVELTGRAKYRLTDKTRPKAPHDPSLPTCRECAHWTFSRRKHNNAIGRCRERDADRWHDERHPCNTKTSSPTGDEVAAATATDQDTLTAEGFRSRPLRATCAQEAAEVTAAMTSVTVEPVAIADSGSGVLPLLEPAEVANTCGTCVAWDGGCSVCEVVGDELTANSPACSDWAPAPTAEQVREGTALGLQFLDDMREVVLGAEKRAASGEPTLSDLVTQLEEDRRELDSQAQHLVNAIDAERESLTRATEAYRGELERITGDLGRVEARLRELDAMRLRLGAEAAE